MSSLTAAAPCQAEGDFKAPVTPHPEEVAEDLSRCDWAIIRTLERVGLATSLQLEHLHFHTLPESRRGTVCRRTIQRLVDRRVLGTSEPPTSEHGSLAAPTYMLGTAGSLLERKPSNGQMLDGKADWTEPRDQRRAARALAVTQLFVDLLEADRAGALSLEAFRAGPASYWSDGLGHTLEPDAFIRAAQGAATDFWWLEVDQEPESTARILAKVRAYLGFLKRGEPGPDGVVPRIMIGVRTNERAEAVRFMLGGLSEPASQLFVVTVLSDAARIIQKALKEG